MNFCFILFSLLFSLKTLSTSCPSEAITKASKPYTSQQKHHIDYIPTLNQNTKLIEECNILRAENERHKKLTRNV